MANRPMRMLLLLRLASVKMAVAKSARGDSAEGQNGVQSNRKATPMVNKAGRRWTSFSESGYFLYRLMRAMPELCTCLKNFFKSVRRLW